MRVSTAERNVVVVGLVVFLVAFGVVVAGAGVTGEQTETTAVSETVVSTATSSNLTDQLATASDDTIVLSRTETVVNTPVTMATGGETDRSDWTVTGPAGELSVREGRGVFSVQPDAPGEYEVRVRGTDATATFEAREQTAVIEEFAPRLSFHEDGPYRPTRIEALVENAVLRHGDDGLVDAEPSLLSLANRDGNHYLELDGPESEYPEYQEAFEPTVYANYVPDVAFQGEQYDAIHYWFIYTYDPKHSFARLGAHQGDVEWTSVLIDGDGDPAYVLPAAHGGQSVAPYEQFADDRRVTLYPEHRSHATYLRDSSKFDGNDLQVYEFWTDGSADCGDVARFESTFYSEWTGSAERWSPDGETEIEYNLIELTGNEVWASYEGGLAASPGSITAPHARTRFTDPTDRFDGACWDHEQVSGSLSVDSFDTDAGTAEVSVENKGGKPHEFWVTVETSDEILATQSVPVGTSRFGSFYESEQTELTFEADTDDLTVELWLHPPETRHSFDYEDTVVVADGSPVQERTLPLWLTVGIGVISVIIGSYGYERRFRTH